MFITVTHCTTTSMESACIICICMLCQQTSQKRWFANMKHHVILCKQRISSNNNHNEPLLNTGICWGHTIRAVSAALHTPQLGGHVATGGPKFQSRHHLAPQRKLRSPKLKCEALEISEFRGPVERKVLYSFFRPLWKQGISMLQLLLGAPLKAK